MDLVTRPSLRGTGILMSCIEWRPIRWRIGIRRKGGYATLRTRGQQVQSLSRFLRREAQRGHRITSLGHDKLHFDWTTLFMAIWSLVSAVCSGAWNRSKILVTVDETRSYVIHGSPSRPLFHSGGYSRSAPLFPAGASILLQALFLAQ